MLRIATIATCLCACLGANAAVELDRIPAEHRWVLHLDLQRALQGELGAWADEVLTNETTAARIRLLEAVTGIDPRRDLRTITISGIDNQQDRAVALIVGDFDPERIRTLAAAAEGHQTFRHHDHVIHHWLDAKHEPPKPQYGTLIDTDLLVIAGDRSVLTRTIDAIDGRVESLDGDPEFAELARGDAAVVLGAATDLDAWRELKPRAAMLREVDRLHLTLDQVDGALRLQLAITAKQEPKAQQLLQVVQGLLALHGLGQRQAADPAIQQVIQSLEATRAGSTVHLQASLPVAELKRLVEQHRDGNATP